MSLHRDTDLSFIEHRMPCARPISTALGLLGLCAGAFFLHAILEVAPTKQDPQGARLALGALGLLVTGVLGLVCATLATSCRSVHVDLEQSTVTAETRFLWFARSRTAVIEEDAAVLHSEREVAGGEHTRHVWFVELVTGETVLELYRAGDSTRGRAWAERYAEFLDLPLAETVDGVLAYRQPEELDRSVVDQGLAEGLRWPESTVSERVSWERGSEGSIAVTIRPPGDRDTAMVGGLLLAVSVAVAIAGLCFLAADAHTGALVTAAILAPVLGGFAWLGAALVHESLYRVERWRIDRNGVGSDGLAAARLAAREIEQVAAGPGLVSVRSDDGQRELGWAMTDEEIQSVRSLVLLTLSGAPAPAG